jgi:hypothetical protein
MIRDPSDGSVRPQKPAPDFKAPQNTAERDPSVMPDWAGAGPVIDPTTSGLQTGSSKPENLARLEKSREWLKQYRDAADAVKRVNDKGEIPPAKSEGT